MAEILTCDVGTATATGDTTETSLGTITLPSNATRIIGIGVSMGGAGLTTLENPSGTFRVNINNKDVTPGKFPVRGAFIVTSGAVPSECQVVPVNWDNVQNSAVSFWITMDMANTINPTARAFVYYYKQVQ